MPFYWICPGCSHKNFYSGSKTTNVVVTCKGCKNVIKASSHKKPEKKADPPPETTDKLPKTTNTQYTTSIVNRPSKIQVKIGDVNWLIVLEVMDRGISTIRNKSGVKNKKGSYYYDFLKWSVEFKKIESIAEVMKLLEVSGK